MRLTSLIRKVPAIAASLALTVMTVAVAPVSADPVADKRAQAAHIAQALEDRARR